jgi:hypothetical protein
MPVLGIIASSTQQGRTTAVGSYDALATIIVPSGGLAQLVFAGIPTGYQHLQIRFTALTSRPTYGYDGLYWNFNGDAGANYSLQTINGNGGGATPGTGNNNSQTNGYMDFALGTTVANYPGSGILDILNYTSTRFKTVRGLGGADLNGSIGGVPGRVNYISGTWNSSAAITNINFSPVNNNFAEKTIFSLYGVK